MRSTLFFKDLNLCICKLQSQYLFVDSFTSIRSIIISFNRKGRFTLRKINSLPSYLGCAQTRVHYITFKSLESLHMQIVVSISLYQYVQFSDPLVTKEDLFWEKSTHCHPNIRMRINMCALHYFSKAWIFAYANCNLNIFLWTHSHQYVLFSNPLVANLL